MANAINVKDASGTTVSVATNDAVKTSVDAVKTAVDLVTTAVGGVDSSVDAVGALITTLDGSVDAVTTAVAAVGATLTASSVTQLGVRTIAQSPAVNIASDQIVNVDQKTTAHDITVAITRPSDATPYTAGDVVGDVTAGHGKLTFAGVAKTGGGPVMVTGAHIRFDNNVAPATAYRLHLYASAPAGTALADNVAFDLPSTDRDAYLGWVDIPAPVLLGSTAFTQALNVGLQLKLTTADVYGYLQVLSAYTPGNGVVYKVTLHTLEI